MHPDLTDEAPAGRRMARTVPIHWLIAALHVALLLLLYGQALGFDYVHYDDTDYVTENPAVLAGLGLDGVRWAFTSFYMSNWHPLTWLSHMADVSIAGSNPAFAHLHNLILHGINSLLVYALLLRYCGSVWKSAALSLVFLVHPLHVESVAWIAERKDLLCAMFFLLALLAYDDYRRYTRRATFLWALLAFVLALLAKPMAVTLPAVLLVLDFFVYRRYFSGAGKEWPSGFDYAGALREKIPFIVISAGSCMVTLLAQDAGNSVAYLEGHTLADRWQVATAAYLTYLKQWLLPINLAAFYPIDTNPSALARWLPGPALLAMLGLALAASRRLPLLAAGLCLYLVTLLPVIGLVQVGSQAHADRYMYLPSLGVLLACTCLLPSRAHPRFRLSALLTGIFILFLSALGYFQVGYWQNQYTLFSRTLAVTGPSFTAHIHLADAYLKRGMPAEAERHARACTELRPDVGDGYQAMGNAALAQQDFARAESFFRKALEHGPALPVVLNNLGISLAEQGRLEAGIRSFEAALQVDGQFKAAQENLVLYRARLAAGDSQ
jgi:tetratricopeptide (TPR) repeat protein